MSCATENLVAALRGRVPEARLADARATPWFSATFAGARHIVTLTVAGAADAARLLDGLDEDEIPLASGFVADIRGDAPVADGDRLRVRIEALTIAED